MRTKSDCEIHDVDVAEYCEEQLPKLLLEHGELAARGLRHLDLPPLALEVDGTAYTFTPEDGTIVVRSGVDDGAIHVVLDQQSFSDLVQEVLTATALTTARSVDIRHGTAVEFNDWDIVLRAMIDGRPVHEPGTITFQDRDGDPLDLHRSFTLDDDDAEMAHFLAEAGYLHLRGWFDAAEMDVISDDIDRALPHVHAGRRPLLVGHARRRHRPVRAPPALRRALARDRRAPRRSSLPPHRGLSPTTATAVARSRATSSRRW